MNELEGQGQLVILEKKKIDRLHVIGVFLMVSDRPTSKETNKDLN